MENNLQKALIEVHQINQTMLLERRNSTIQHTKWNNFSDQELVMRYDYHPVVKLNEDTDYVPRFVLKKKAHPLFAQYPPNKEFKYSRQFVETAIAYGMILSIQYRGETGKSNDKFVQGHARIIYPLVIGKSAEGNILLRGYHLRGWSVSASGNMQKEWRMFRADRIMSMSFTGSFFRLPPEGYNENDKGMKGGIFAKADFEKIRANQKTLIQNNVIQNKKEVVFDDKNKVSVVQIDKTDTVLDLARPFENPNLDEKDKNYIRLSFLKSMTTNRRICIIGALGQRGNTVKLTERGKYLGTFKVLKTCMGTSLGKPHLQNVEGATEYEAHIFIKKIN